MANEFDNTDPLQLNTEPVQASNITTVGMEGGPQLVQPPDPASSTAAMVEARDAGYEDDFKLFDYYRSKNYSPDDILGLMTHDGSRSKSDVLGAMNAQYEIQRREIMEDNDRMKVEQAKVEAYMMERQNALNDLLNQREDPPAQSTEVTEAVADPVAAMEFENVDDVIDAYIRPEGYDTPELARLYKENEALVGNGLNMNLSTNGLIALKNNQQEDVETALDELGYFKAERGELDVMTGENIDLLTAGKRSDIYNKYLEGDPEATKYINNFLSKKYDQAKGNAKISMGNLAGLSNELNIPWQYDADSDIHMTQAMLEAFKISDEGEQSTQAFEDNLTARRAGLQFYEDDVEAWGTFLANSKVGFRNFANQTLAVMPKQIHGLYLDQTGDDEKAKQKFKEAEVISTFLNETTRQRNLSRYNMNDEEQAKGIWDSVSEGNWELAGKKVASGFEDIFGDVILGAATLGGGAVIRKGAQEALEEGAEQYAKSKLKYYLGTQARRQNTLRMVMGGSAEAAGYVAFGLRGAGGAYQSVFDDPTRSKSEKLFLASTVGAAEIVLGRLFRAADMAISKGFTALGGVTSAGRRQAMREGIKGITKRQILQSGGKAVGGEFLEEAGIEAIDQGVRVIQDRIAGRPTSQIDWYAIMDAGTLGLIGSGPLTAMSTGSSYMAHSKFQKRRGDLAQAMSDIDQKMSMTSDPEVVAGLKARKKAYQTMLNTLEGMSEKEYSKLTDSEKRQINTLHRELALTRDEINAEKDSKRKKNLQDRYDKLYEQKAAIEKASENRKSAKPNPSFSDAEGNQTVAEPRDVSRKKAEEHDNLETQKDESDLDIDDAVQRKLDSKLASISRATERISSDPENSTKHARTVKRMTTQARNLAKSLGMTDAEVDQMIQDAISQKPKVKPDAKKQRRGERQFNNAFKALEEATTPEGKFDAIASILNNVFQGGELTTEQQDLLDKTLAELKDQGFELRFKPGDKINEGDIVDIRLNNVVEEGGDRIITRIIKPAILKDGEQIQGGKVEVQTGGKLPKSPAAKKVSSRGSVDVSTTEPIDVNEDWIGEGEGKIPLSVISQIERMKNAFGNALSKLGVNIKLHLDSESMKEATGTDSLGMYDASTKTIHIGPKAKSQDVMEEFGHAMFRTLLKSDSAFASRVYKEIAEEAGLEIGEDGLVVLPENFRESEDLKNLATRNPFARAILITEDLYPDYNPAKRREETIVEAIKQYTVSPESFSEASRKGKGRKRIDVLRDTINNALTRLGFRGNFIKGDESFFRFAEKFKMATEGRETEVASNPQDYSAEKDIVENSERTQKPIKEAKAKRKPTIVPTPDPEYRGARMPYVPILPRHFTMLYDDAFDIKVSGPKDKRGSEELDRAVNKAMRESKTYKEALDKLIAANLTKEAKPKKKRKPEVTIPGATYTTRGTRYIEALPGESAQETIARVKREDRDAEIKRKQLESDRAVQNFEDALDPTGIEPDFFESRDGSLFDQMRGREFFYTDQNGNRKSIQFNDTVHMKRWLDWMSKDPKGSRVNDLYYVEDGVKKTIDLPVDTISGDEEIVTEDMVGQNVNYGDEIASDNDVMLSNNGPIQRPPRQEETDTFESRSRSVFDVTSLVSRAATADSSVRPEGEFVQRQYTPFQLFKNLAYKRFVDKFGDILNLQEDVENFLGRRVASNQDFKSVEQLMYGKAAQDLERLEKKIEGITSKMNELGINSGEMTDYLYALHAKERNDLILEREGVENGSGLSTDDAAEILDGLTPERKAELDQVVKLVRQMQQDTRDMQVEFGLESRENMDVYENQFKNYVTLAGLAVDEADSKTTTHPTGGAGLQVKGPINRQAKGRKTRADNLLAQTIAQANATIVQARKNEALMSLHDLIKENPNSKVWSIVNKADYVDKDNVVPIRVKGEQKYLRFVDPSYAATLKNMTIPRTTFFTRLLRAPNNWLRRSFTTLNPEFVISNFARDIQSALFSAAAEADIQGGQILGKKVMGDMVKLVGPSLKAIMKETNPDSLGRLFEENPLLAKYYQEFKDDGGKTGWGYVKPLQDIAAELERETGGKTKAQEILGKVKENTIDVVEGVNEAFEDSIRLSSYIAAREAGISRQDAAVFAKNITVNFNKHGEYGQIANSIYLFFNASVQGSARVIRSLGFKAPNSQTELLRKQGFLGKAQDYKNRISAGQKMAAGLTIFSSMLAMIGRGMSDEDEDGVLYWDKIPDYVKERNLIFMFDGKNYIKIPLPYGFNVFANVGTAAVDTAAGGKEVDESMMFLANSIMSSFSPISFGQSKDLFTYLGKAAVPTALKPLAEIMVNETYFGGPVYAEQSTFGVVKPESSMSFKSPKAVENFFEFLNDVTGGSKEKSGLIDVNPDKVWHILDYFGGGAVQFVNRSLETTYRVGQKLTVDNDIRVSFNDVPLMRKLYGEPSKYYDFQKYKDREEEITQLYRELKDPKIRKKQFEKDPDRYKNVGRLYEAIKVINRRLKAIRKAKRDAKDIKDYADRMVKIEELMQLERTEIMRFNKLYDEIYK